jgi:hypothetical protein
MAISRIRPRQLLLSPESLFANSLGELAHRGFERELTALEPTVDGNVIYNTDTSQIVARTGGGRFALTGSLYASTTASATVISTAAESFFAAPQQFTLPIAAIQVGRVLNIRAGGRYGLDVGPTVNFKLYIGDALILDTGAVNPSTSASLNRNWVMDLTVAIGAIGSPGSVSGAGWTILPGINPFPSTATGATPNFATNRTISASVQFGLASATNRAVMNTLVVSMS